MLVQAVGGIAGEIAVISLVEARVVSLLKGDLSHRSMIRLTCVIISSSVRGKAVHGFSEVARVSHYETLIRCHPARSQ